MTAWTFEVPLDDLRSIQSWTLNPGPLSGFAGDQVVQRALTMAFEAHRGQVRKYTGEPYICHPIEVESILRRLRYRHEVRAAALMHDAVEDTEVTLEVIAAHFSPRVVELVDYMTERDWSGNRRVRKTKERIRLSKGDAECQALKLADLISNARSIITHDPGFARVFVREAKDLAVSFTAADRRIVEIANRVLDSEHPHKEELK